MVALKDLTRAERKQLQSDDPKDQKQLRSTLGISPKGLRNLQRELGARQRSRRKQRRKLGTIFTGLATVLVAVAWVCLTAYANSGIADSPVRTMTLVGGPESPDAYEDAVVADSGVSIGETNSLLARAGIQPRSPYLIFHFTASLPDDDTKTAEKLAWNLQIPQAKEFRTVLFGTDLFNLELLETGEWEQPQDGLIRAEPHIDRESQSVDGLVSTRLSVSVGVQVVLEDNALSVGWEPNSQRTVDVWKLQWVPTPLLPASVRAASAVYSPDAEGQLPSIEGGGVPEFQMTTCPSCRALRALGDVTEYEPGAFGLSGPHNEPVALTLTTPAPPMSYLLPAATWGGPLLALLFALFGLSWSRLSRENR